MEDWLYKKDEYLPEDDRDKFIDKSIKGFLKILSLIKRNKACEIGFIYKINPILKFIFCLVIIFLLSLSRSISFILTADVYILLLLSLMEGEVLREILKVGLLVPAFTLLILLPSMIKGNMHNSIMILLKVTGSITFININSYTTKWTELTKVLKCFFISDIFILILDIAIRYIYILGEFSLDMLEALKLRSVGKNKNKYSSMSSIMGSLFLKSRNMSEEMYFAMECRGFTGEYSTYSNLKLKIIDLVYILINLFLISVYFL